jgi:hypothetical protein
MWGSQGKTCTQGHEAVSRLFKSYRKDNKTISRDFLGLLASTQVTVLFLRAATANVNSGYFGDSWPSPPHQ